MYRLLHIVTNCKPFISYLYIYGLHIMKYFVYTTLKIHNLSDFHVFSGTRANLVAHSLSHARFVNGSLQVDAVDLMR